MTLWVVKIGTSLLRGETAATIEGYARCFAAAMARGDQVVLVTSGAVGLGCQKLAMSSRPDTVVALQAAAAIGQGALMALYERAMARHGRSVAQVLLTRSDLADRRRYQNASGTLRQLLSWGVLPVINENDALSTAELRFGDNDTLSALVAAAVEAQQLILLTDVDRLYSSDPRVDADAEPISDVRHPRDLDQLEQGAGDGGRWGTGGMTTKLAAARIATASGITVQLADGRNPSRLEALLQGERGGTVFHPHPEPLGNRRSWLAHVLRPEGELQLDAGACDALKHRGASLLLVGVTAVRGDFAANQPVQLLDPNGVDLGRGLCSMDSDQLRAAMNAVSPGEASPVVVHRDALVLRSR
ncbi:glutamate 5-kinase [Synechococcus sp. HB1133]|uniref:glutamate 5-kinase n=1 Tax=unclassified Synechococcus TaxID=2626047 RepID=UPI00140785B6|nr:MULTISPECIES: glutamate 5-kinase [unclassified Synechococcus]MCB4422646.1 glutamate 5-kinase [Synechococcus sp. HB1133]MCB4430391.1 glutamate 5-kinase [Synechococcus sp. HBA1120]NHI81594.1 glutamate 5-kinase [Synechococcus sp. HB1133]